MTRITLQELIQLSKNTVTKYYNDDPELWSIIDKRIDYISVNGTLEADDEDDDFSNDNIIYTLSRKYCTGEQIDDLQPLFELWQTVS